MLLIWHALLSVHLASAARSGIGANDPQSIHRSRAVDEPSFAHGAPVDMWVNKLTSSRTQRPMDYRHLPLCQAPQPRSNNASSPTSAVSLGQGLTRNHMISPSPYAVWMRKDLYCEQLCIQDFLARQEEDLVVSQAIFNEYRHNWIMDQSLPAALKTETDTYLTTRYFGGIPLGFVAPWNHSKPTPNLNLEFIDHGGGISRVNELHPGATTDKPPRAFVYNHVNINVHYRASPTKADHFQVVKFVVEPFSIAHQFEAFDEQQEKTTTSAYALPRLAQMKDPIPSCRQAFSPDRKERLHTEYDMLGGGTSIHNKVKLVGPQPASGRVLFTYDVIWWEDRELDWSNRWDIYFSMDHAMPIQYRWRVLCNSVIWVVVVTGLGLALIKSWLQHQARRLERIRRLPNVNRGGEAKNNQTEPEVNSDSDSTRSNVEGRDDGKASGRRQDDLSSSDDDGGDDDSSAAEDAWRHDLEHNVFVPPTWRPRLLIALCGLGAQLLATGLCVLAMLVSGWPLADVRVVGGGARGGVLAWFVTAWIVTYTAVAPLVAYFTARLNRHVALVQPGTNLCTTQDETLIETGGPANEESEAGDGDQVAHDERSDSANGPSSPMGKEVQVVTGHDDENRQTLAGAFWSAWDIVGSLDVSSAWSVLFLQIAAPLSGIAALLVVNLIQADTHGLHVTFPLRPVLQLLLVYLFVFLPLLLLGYFSFDLRRSNSERTRRNAFMDDGEDGLAAEPNHRTRSTKAKSTTPWYANPAVPMVASGASSFAILHNEWYGLLMALFRQEYYDAFGFLLIAFMVSALCTALFCMLGTYTLLSLSGSNDHDWWWSAFAAGGSVAIAGYGFAVTYPTTMLSLTWIGFATYLVAVTWICVAWFCMMGFVGVCSSFWFNQRLYQAVKLAR